MTARAGVSTSSEFGVGGPFLRDKERVPRVAHKGALYSRLDVSGGQNTWPTIESCDACSVCSLSDMHAATIEYAW